MVCWGNKDNWLVTGSHPDWISAGGRANLTLPDEAKDSEFAGVGNFSFLPSVLDWAEEEARGQDEGAIDMFRSLELEKANWIMWSNIESDGKSSHMVMVLRNWDWRRSLKIITDFAAKH